MAEHEDPKSLRLGTAAASRVALVRKLPVGRRLLVATIGAATVQFATGCGAKVSNSSGMPVSVEPVSGHGGRAVPPGNNAGYYVANLMAPPFIPMSGMGGRNGAAGVPAKGGSGGASGAAHGGPSDIDAGVEDDAGHA